MQSLGLDTSVVHAVQRYVWAFLQFLWCALWKEKSSHADEGERAYTTAGEEAHPPTKPLAWNQVVFRVLPASLVASQKPQNRDAGGKPVTMLTL